MNPDLRCKRTGVGVVSILMMAASLMEVSAAAAADTPPVPPPTPAEIVSQFQKNEGTFPGYRRNHAKGVCIYGYFRSSGRAARYSVAQVFAPGERTPVIGRLSIPGTSPYAWDDSTPIRGMALELTQADGEQWRTAMNAVPAFPVATPEADYEFMKLQQPDPATGDPDPQKLAAFFAAHPRANAFRMWVLSTTPSASYATETYNSLDAFELVDARGRRHAVRWSMVPDAKAGPERIPSGDPDYLVQDLRRRLSRGPLKWRLMIVLADAGDPINDAAVAWPADRRRIDAGTLVVRSSEPQRTGACRSINFDPTVLPAGIELSEDPLLRFRSRVYAESHRRRVREEAAAEKRP